MRELKVNLWNTIKKLIQYCGKEQSIKVAIEKKKNLYIQGILKRSKLMELSEKRDKGDERKRST